MLQKYLKQISVSVTSTKNRDLRVAMVGDASEPGKIHAKITLDSSQ